MEAHRIPEEELDRTHDVDLFEMVARAKLEGKRLDSSFEVQDSILAGVVKLVDKHLRYLHVRNGEKEHEEMMILRSNSER